jgi:iron-sulfur cluster repair protein YtfE (RIC family)
METTIAEAELDCRLPVRRVVERYPATREVFARFGVDACCGGGASVEDAARIHGVNAAELCAALRAAAEAA